MTGTPTKTPSREVNETIIGDQGGYFDLVVKPVLQKGHEGELCSWLKEMSLIRSFMSCTNTECNSKSLIWSPARIIDKYIWTCSNCSTKVSIREHSFFLGIKCGLKLCLQAILAWCQGIDTDVAAEYLNLKEHFIKKVYEKCAKITELYIKKHVDEWTLGGPGMVVIVDEFPGGFMRQNGTDVTVTKKRNNNANNILCIAEANANAIPPRMWFHVFKSHPEPLKSNKTDKSQLKNEAVEEALQEIIQHVVPDTYIVANSKARCCNYESLLELKRYNIVSVEFLQKYDVPGKTEILRSLETIWQTGIDVCEEVQEATPTMTEQIISSHLWRQRFCTSPSMAFQYMLNHISEFNKFT